MLFSFIQKGNNSTEDNKLVYKSANSRYLVLNMTTVNYSLLNSTSVKVHVHLCEVLNDDKEINATLIKNYVLQVKNNRSIIFPNEDQRDDVQENSTISLFVGTINELLNSGKLQHADPEGAVFDLLDAILEYLTIEEILQFYPLEFIIEGLKGDASVCCMIIRILRRNCQSQTTLGLFEDTTIMDTIITRYFDTEAPLSVVNQVELLVSELVDTSSPIVPQKLLSGQFKGEYKEARESSDKIVRFLDYILILVRYVVRNGYSLDENYYVLPKLLFSDNDDILQVVLLIQFYNKLIDELNIYGKDNAIVKSIIPCLRNLTNMYTERQKDEFVELYYANEIADLMSSISYSKVPFLVAFTEELVHRHELFKSYNLYLHLDCDVKLLSKFNPEALNIEIISDILDEISIFSQRYFSILLNCIGSEKLFHKLTPRLTTQAISKLSLDMLYRLLLQMSKFQYSVKYLMSDLPNVVSNYLIDSPDVTESEIWSMKKDTIQNILLSNTELSVWKGELSKVFSNMCNGRKIQSIEPRVDVVDRSAL